VPYCGRRLPEGINAARSGSALVRIAIRDLLRLARRSDVRRLRLPHTPLRRFIALSLFLHAHARPSMPPKTVAKPIQEDSVAQPMPAGGAAPINDSEVVDEGPANANIPSSQHDQFDRSGTQDALRGQGNSAAPSSTLSRENQAPVAREQKKAAEFGDQFGVSVEGKGDGEGFKTTSVKEGEPRAGKVRPLALYGGGHRAAWCARCAPGPLVTGCPP